MTRKSPAVFNRLNFLGFHPHLHILSTDGCFYGEGMFRPALARIIVFKTGNPIMTNLVDLKQNSWKDRSGPGVSPLFELKHLEEIFKHKVFKTLLSKEKIASERIDMNKTWRHSGFNVFCGPRIQPGDEQAMENLARYIVRAFLSRL
jgi:hypothetical protein